MARKKRHMRDDSVYGESYYSTINRGKHSFMDVYTVKEGEDWSSPKPKSPRKKK
jgi:hypothetical protein